MIYCKQDIVQNVTGRSTHSVREKEIYSIRRKCSTMRRCGSSASLCVLYQSLSAIYLSPFKAFIYIGLYLVWAISFQKRIIQKEPRRCLIMIAVMMVFWMLVRMCKFEIPYEMPTALRYAWYLYYIPMLLLPTVSLYLAFYIRQRRIINYRKDGVCCFFRHCF